MKFSINKEILIEIMGDYINILKENPIKPILAGLFIQAKDEKIIFKGTNLEIDLIRYTDGKIETEGQVLIKPALLLEYIKLVEETDINFQKGEGSLIVNHAEFSILDDSSYPELTETTPATILSTNTNKFANLLDKVKFITSISGTNDLLFSSIKMIFKDNFIELASTDSYRLIYLKDQIPNNEYKEVLVPAESVSIIHKIFKDLDEDFSLSATDEKLILTWKNSYFSCKLLSLSFPNFKALIESNNNDKKFEFNREELVSSLKKVISVTKNSNDSKNVATFNFRGNELLISGFSTSAKINQKVSMIKNGDDLKLGMNCKYIKDFIDNINNNIIIEAKNANSMLRITEESNPDYIYLVMPVNIRV